MDDDLKQHLTTKDTWLRGGYIIFYAICYSISEFVLFAVVIFQFLSILFTGSPNERLLQLGQSIAVYVYQIIQFITVNSEEKPYPIGDWPAGSPDKNELDQFEATNYDDDVPKS